MKNQGYIEEGMECFDKALELDEEYYMAWYNKGNVYYDKDEFEKAIECYDNTIKINPEHFKAWCNKGNMLYGQKKYKEALECYDKALEINPGDELTIQNKEMVQEKIGK